MTVADTNVRPAWRGNATTARRTGGSLLACLLLYFRKHLTKLDRKPLLLLLAASLTPACIIPVGPEDLDLSPDDLPPILPLAEAKDKFQRDYINEILTLNSGNRTKTARDLGVDPRTIFRHLEKGENGEDIIPAGNGNHEGGA